MSVYAYFEIAGIWRPIELFCVEPVHVARLTYSTVFDKQYKDADLAVDVKVVNEQAESGGVEAGPHRARSGRQDVKLNGLERPCRSAPGKRRR